MYHIRLAEEKDLAELHEIEIKAAARFPEIGLLEDRINQPFPKNRLQDLIKKRQAWVACKGKEPVGFVAVSRINDWIFGEEIDVLPEHGRQGLGKYLIETVIEWAHKEKFSAMIITTFKSVPWNAPYYRRFGFEVVSTEEWSPEMWGIYNHEKTIGLPMADRVFMRLKFKN